MGFFNIQSVAKHQKIEGGRDFIFGNSLTMPKKLKGGTVWDFSTSIRSQNSKKVEGGPFGKTFFRKKVSQCRKKIEKGSRPV